jgi:hypothetical protein
MPKFKEGQLFYYMYLNAICKSKVISYHQDKNGNYLYSDNLNKNISEKFMFNTSKELFNFQSGKIKKK